MTTTTNDRRELIEMFADRTAGESYNRNRLVTRETPNGNVALIAYGWMKLAEYNEEREAITLFVGHAQASPSRTITKWVNDVKRVIGERRRIIESGETPRVRGPNTEGYQYVNEYIRFSGGLSKVEQNAFNAVEKSLQFLDN